MVRAAVEARARLFQAISTFSETLRPPFRAAALVGDVAVGEADSFPYREGTA